MKELERTDASVILSRDLEVISSLRRQVNVNGEHDPDP